MAERDSEARSEHPSRSSTTLRDAWTVWLEGAKAGTIRTRSGDRYKPSALRSYDAGMEARVLPVLEGAKVSALELRDFQDLADQLLADGHDPSTIRNTFMGLRALYRRAVARGDVALNPTAGLQLPAVRGRRDRIASVSEADGLLAVLPDGDRAVWSTAFFAGLRRGELMALDVQHAFDANGVASTIAVERSYDPVAGEYITPKSEPGHVASRSRRSFAAISRRTSSDWAEARDFCSAAPRRSPSMTAPSRYELRRRGMQRDSRRSRSTKPDTRTRAFSSPPVSTQRPISTYMGHASITITLDRYGHLMPGNEAEAADLLDAYIAREREARTRESQVVTRGRRRR